MDEKDALYLKGLTEGDRLIFEKIFREYYPVLCHYARRYVPDQLTAEEVVQDFFCKLWDKHHEIVINTAFGGYLRKSLINHCLNYNRKVENDRRFIGYGDNIEETQGSSGAEEYSELGDRITRAISELPEKRREIFELNRFEGLKYQEIAERLNINVKTVETQMARSLEFMRKHLKEFLTIILLIINELQS
jgi:RNA polymerase sigma-70 factor, ECF subfamily